MNVLEQAAEITSGDRNTFYGHPADNHGCTAAFWRWYIQRKYGIGIALTPRDVCMMMILQKVSRDANQDKTDNLVDICGYARNAEMVEEREHARENHGQDVADSVRQCPRPAEEHAGAVRPAEEAWQVPEDIAPSVSDR